MLRDIGQLETTRIPSNSAAELAEMTRWPGGTQSRSILAAQPFDLGHESGHRVAVKAIEIGEDGAPGLSLTSLQPLAGACH